MKFMAIILMFMDLGWIVSWEASMIVSAVLYLVSGGKVAKRSVGAESLGKSVNS